MVGNTELILGPPSEEEVAVSPAKARIMKAGSGSAKSHWAASHFEPGRLTKKARLPYNFLTPFLVDWLRSTAG